MNSYTYDDVPDRVREILQSVADEINSIPEFSKHAFVLIDDDDMAKARKLSVAPVIAVMYGGMFGVGQNSGANTGARTTGNLVEIEVQIFVIGDTTLLCEKPTNNADFKMLPTLHNLREHLRTQTLGCQQWRFGGEQPQEISEIYGYMQTWRGTFFLFN